MPTIIEGKVFLPASTFLTKSDDNRELVEEPEENEAAVFAAVVSRDLKKLQKIIQNPKNREEILQMTDYAGNTPLLLAGKSGWVKGARFLIDHGADVNEKNFDGKGLRELSPLLQNWDNRLI